MTCDVFSVVCVAVRCLCCVCMQFCAECVGIPALFVFLFVCNLFMACAVFVQVIINLECFEFTSDVDFVKALLIEKSVFVMPGKVGIHVVYYFALLHTCVNKIYRSLCWFVCLPVIVTVLTSSEQGQVFNCQLAEKCCIISL